MRDRGIRLELESFCATALLFYMLCRCVGVVCVCVMCGWLVIAGMWPASGQFPAGWCHVTVWRHAESAQQSGCCGSAFLYTVHFPRVCVKFRKR